MDENFDFHLPSFRKDTLHSFKEVVNNYLGNKKIEDSEKVFRKLFKNCHKDNAKVQTYVVAMAKLNNLCIKCPSVSPIHRFSVFCRTQCHWFFSAIQIEEMDQWKEMFLGELIKCMSLKELSS